MSTTLNSNRSKAYALLLLNCLIWGLAAPLIKKSLDYVTPTEFLFSRFLLASLIFLPYFFWTFKRNIDSIWLLVVLALLGTPLTLIPLYEGLKLTTSLEGAILSATGPIITIIGGVIFLKEKVTKQEKIGLTVAIFGTLLLIFGPLTSLNLAISKDSVVGAILITLSNFIWTAFCLISKRLKTNAHSLSLVSFLVGLVTFGLLLYIEGGTISNLGIKLSVSPFAILGIAFQAILGSIIAFWAYIKAQEYIEASQATVFTYLQPVFAFPLAFFWLREPLSPTLIFSSIIIALGVFLSERHK